MKKNISINIGGIIFHIEEDGYEQLKEYLESINKYFSTFDDSTEIIADIESRIAEIFLSKLNEGKQVITPEDVTALIGTMGSIQDFQAVEEQEAVIPPGKEETKQESQEEASEAPAEEPSTLKKLYRDGNRKLLAGVASGIAHYFSVDPLWIRLLFIILIFDVFLTFSISGLLILGYVIMWIVVPESNDLKEDKKLKKMYRNPDDRVLGGVASGVAAYFGTDVVVIRLIFVLAILLAGSGLIAYLILWIILPEATSITDKVQMKGEPVTLSNIESSIKSSLNVSESGEESAFVKILLFPFRLIATLINGLVKALGPVLLFIVEAIRIIAGLVLSITGVSMLFALIISAGVLLGLFAGGDLVELDGIPFELIEESFPPFAIVAALIAVAIPSLALILAGIAIIGKTKTVSAPIGWSLFALWLVSIIGLGFVVPGIVTDFKREGTHREELTFTVPNKTAVIKIREVGMDDYSATTLRLRGHEKNEFKLIQEFESRGRTRKEAIDNARMIDYGVRLNDSIFVFDSNIAFKENAQFRGQRLSMTFYIPYNTPFVIDESLRHIIYNTIYRYNYRVSDLDENNEWIFDESGLQCITCEGYNGGFRRNNRSNSYRGNFDVDGYFREFNFRNFTDLDIKGPFEIKIERGSAYEIVVSGDPEVISDVDVSGNGDRLRVSNDLDLLNIGKSFAPTLQIMMPNLEYLYLTGASKATVNGFDEEYLRVKLGGANSTEMDVEVKELDIELNSATKLELIGSGDELNVDLKAASILDAYDFKVEDAQVSASPTAAAELFVTQTLEIDASVASHIKYRGQPRVRRL